MSSEANEISEKEAKKTIACDHITKALETLGFSDYIPAVLEAAAQHKETQKVRLGSMLLRVVLCLLIIIGPREARQQVRGERNDAGGVGGAAETAV